MRRLITTWTAVAALTALAAPFSPALAHARRPTPYLLADMMPGAPAPGAMPGGMMDDKMGAMPPAAPGAMAGPAAGMAPPQQPGAPAPGGMPGMMMGDKMAMPPAAGAMPGMPAGAAPPAAAMAGPGGMMPPAMMSMMSSMMGQMQSPAAPLDRVEGRIAFMKAELGVTDAQAPGWDEFAQALRTARGHLTEAGQALAASQNGQFASPSRLEAYERHLSMRLDSLHSARESFQRLYAILSPAQKQTADELVSPLLASF